MYEPHCSLRRATRREGSDAKSVDACETNIPYMERRWIRNYVNELMEREERERPFCTCGEHTVLAARDGRLWLECASLQHRRAFIRKLVSLDFNSGHLRRPLTELYGLRFTAI
jgi:hypothetical protein